VIAGELRQLSQPGNLVEDTHRQVRMQPNTLKLGRRQGRRSRPDLVRHSDAAEVVRVARSAGQRRGIGIQPGGQGGVTGEPGHRS